MSQQERVKLDSESRRTKRMDRRRQEILRVAARMFADLGYERTTLDMIADELGLSKPSLYYYVKSKEDVLAHIFQDIFQNILDRVEAETSAGMDPLERLRRLIIIYVTQACTYPEGRILFLYESHLLNVCNPELQNWRDRYQQRVVEAISAGIEQGVFHVEHARLAALALIGALHSIPIWYLPHGPLSPLQIGEAYASILIGGLVSPLPASH
jgi:AcrR family transcriptional regulator